LSYSISYDSGYGMRGIAMLMIILAHSLNEYEVFHSVLCRALLIPDYGILGCGLFFLLSGYGLGHSLEKHKDHLTWHYLGERVWKLFKPLIFAFVLITLVLYVQRRLGNGVTLDFGNTLWLSFPDGTDLWFFKIILLNYIVLFALYKLYKPLSPSEALEPLEPSLEPSEALEPNKPYVLLSLALLHLLLIGVLWHEGAGRYWYVSNLCFIVGYGLVVFGDRFAKYKKAIVTASVVVFAPFAVLSFLQKYFIPGEIFGVIAFSLLCCYIFKEKKNWSPALTYIGKNSLCYYLFCIPVMAAIPYAPLHWSLYFLLVFSLTSLLVLLWNMATKRH